MSTHHHAAASWMPLDGEASKQAAIATSESQWDARHELAREIAVRGKVLGTTISHHPGVLYAITARYADGWLEGYVWSCSARACEDDVMPRRRTAPPRLFVVS